MLLEEPQTGEAIPSWFASQCEIMWHDKNNHTEHGFIFTKQREQIRESTEPRRNNPASCQNMSFVLIEF